MANGLYFYKLVSPYPEDITKNCKLTINEIDSNFLTLKDADIKSFEFDRENKLLVLTRNNGEVLVASLSSVTYDLSVSTEDTSEGLTMTIRYDGPMGEETVTIDGIVTRDNLQDVIGSEILTKVITDGTLVGDGTIDNPLGLAPGEKTGMYAPVIKFIDITAGEHLPIVSRAGTRFVTAEYLSVYGYLYNWDAVEIIKQVLEDEGRGWRIPTKEDWDKLLNSIEPCEYRNHESTDCHKELGKVSGKYLKTACGWIEQEECDCLSVGGNSRIIVVDEDDPGDMYDPSGIDKYGFSIYPSGVGEKTVTGGARTDGYKELSYFWTDTHICDDENQDLYVKVFKSNKGGVVQEAECTDRLFSIRLVKDYTGGNYFGSEIIGGNVYNTSLAQNTRQVWTTCNLYMTNGLTPVSEGENFNYCEPNNGDIDITKKVFFINEWNGSYWEKKLLVDGDTFVINESAPSGETIYNLEYRVQKDDECNYELVPTDDTTTENVLRVVIPMIEAIDAKVEAETERAVAAEQALDEKINAETARATEAEQALDSKIDTETQRAKAAEQTLDEKIDAETARATEAEDVLDEKISAETERAEAAEHTLDEKINAETARATEKENQIETALNAEIVRSTTKDEEHDGKISSLEDRMLVTNTTYVFKFDKENGGVTVPAVGGQEEDALKIIFDGNLGEF